MKCKAFSVRSKKYTKFLYCKFKKKEITFDDCKKCSDFKLRNGYKLKNKSNKLAKAEKKRFSILTSNFKKCYKCDNDKKHIHEIYKGANRITSIRNGFCVPLCEKCHARTENDIEFLRELQIECQMEFEKTHMREEFMNLTGRNFL